MKSSVLTLRKPIPLARAIRWVPAGLFTPPRTLDDLALFITQSALREVMRHLRSDPERELLGFLLGELYECPETGARYVVVNTAVRTGHAISESDRILIPEEEWLGVQLEVRRRRTQLVGWYHSAPFVGPHPARADLDTHRALFTEPWQCGLVIATSGEAPTGAFFRSLMGERTGGGVLIPFYELPDEDEPIPADGRKRTLIDWVNYETRGTVERDETERRPFVATPRPTPGGAPVILSVPSAPEDEGDDGDDEYDAPLPPPSHAPPARREPEPRQPDDVAARTTGATRESSPDVIPLTPLRPERGGRGERGERPDRGERAGRSGHAERGDRSTSGERGEPGGRGESGARPDRGDGPDRTDRRDRRDPPDRGDRSERPDLSIGGNRPVRPAEPASPASRPPAAAPPSPPQPPAPPSSPPAYAAGQGEPQAPRPTTPRGGSGLVMLPSAAELEELLGEPNAPEKAGGRRVFRYLLVALVVAAVAYLYLWNSGRVELPGFLASVPVLDAAGNATPTYGAADSENQGGQSGTIATDRAAATPPVAESAGATLSADTPHTPSAGSAASGAPALPAGAAPQPAPSDDPAVQQFATLADSLEESIRNFQDRNDDFAVKRIACDGLALGYRAADDAFIALASAHRAARESLDTTREARYRRLVDRMGQVNEEFGASGCPRP